MSGAAARTGGLGKQKKKYKKRKHLIDYWKNNKSKRKDKETVKFIGNLQDYGK